MSKLQLNPAFDPAFFLRKHWQQQPLLLPQLLPGFTDLISPEELAGLACEHQVESRLVTGREDSDWSVRHGPIPESTFTSLPQSHWSVLVQAVDQWVTEVAALRRQFEFIPRWRIDDVMVSYATDDGGVGPHFDHYDVFLLQGSGQRRWQLGDKIADAVALVNDNGINTVSGFKPTQEYVLNAGDALYIPPRYPHWGRSIGNSTCYSIGFRAPALSDMLEGFSDSLIAASSPSQRYNDQVPVLPLHPAAITADVVQAAYAQLQTALDAPEHFTRWFGAFVTQPKYLELREPLSTPLTDVDLLKALGNRKRLHHEPGSRFAFLQLDKDAGMLWFVDGDGYKFPSQYNDVIPQLCEPTSLPAMDFSEFKSTDPVLQVLVRLVNQGSLGLY